MNKQPVSYKQYDSRWKETPYRVPGENSFIGDSGCGPTCAAMVIETLTGKKFTPEDACKWSLDHGYKALHQGTYYTYFAAQFKAYGIDCWQMNWTNTYHKPDHNNHEKALSYLKQGYYLIALMKKGLWTSGGHFVLVWWADDKIRINDPASIKDERLNGDPRTFKNEVAYYWVVDARSFNNPEPKKEESDDMITQEQVDLMVSVAMDKYLANLRDNDSSEWSKKARDFCLERGLITGDENANFSWESFLTKEQLAQVLYNLFHAGMDSEAVK